MKTITTKPNTKHGRKLFRCGLLSLGSQPTGTSALWDEDWRGSSVDMERTYASVARGPRESEGSTSGRFLFILMRIGWKASKGFSHHKIEVEIAQMAIPLVCIRIEQASISIRSSLGPRCCLGLLRRCLRYWQKIRALVTSCCRTLASVFFLATVERRRVVLLP